MGSSAWAGSDRRQRLPANWPQLRQLAHQRNPLHICHWCKIPGGEALDHLNAGDDHRLENLDWIHDRRSVEAGIVAANCHYAKTNAEKPKLRRDPEQHPAL